MADSHGSLYLRLESWLKSVASLGPFAFLVGVLGAWYKENETFTLFAVAFVFANAILGAIVHQIQKTFQWEIFLVKTMKMICIITGVYFVLEGIVSPIGDNAVKLGFIATFQVSTLLYPGSKILKNLFIWSGGEHPPRWMMEKVYNFQKDGNLKKFLDTENNENTEEEN